MCVSCIRRRTHCHAPEGLDSHCTVTSHCIALSTHGIMLHGSLHVAAPHCTSSHATPSSRLVLQLSATVCNCLPLSATVCNCLPLSATVCNCLQLSATVCNCLQLESEARVKAHSLTDNAEVACLHVSHKARLDRCMYTYICVCVCVSGWVCVV